ncbi:ABC transporter permease protein [Altererythrobacter epoxidivorans]|uniref:ABC transporter permease protein n=1 Tax=Altererythrobacter epoxidivorans TaxID=361183 RepID=A0A0M4LWW8_9SPHN|nr:ABC transporter permease/substrate-binding protein [Altererythrobacter epoxidivorans]ALE17597.1 ABC transporter permease protein [Altererythrobacter epoxidivorans]
MSGFIETLAGLGDELSAHVLLSASAIALGVMVALPLAIWAARSPAVARISLGLASLVQTIPALALLALFFPILLSLRAVFGEGLPTLGFLPALLALALYALLPILRNAVTAQANLDPGVLEAADGVGMSQWQKLVLVEAPLSAPFIMAGIRTAAVWTIGAATLATTIGQKSLGDPIFAGLQTQNWALVLAGCLASAGLALLADNLLGLVESGLKQRKKGLVAAGLLAIALGIGGALWAQFGPDRPEDRVVIGAKGFSEQYILARLIGQRLEDRGYAVEYRDGLGSAVAHSAVTTNEIDILVDYTGTIWANMMKRTDNPERDAMIAEIAEWEEQMSGTLMLGRMGFENAYGLAVTQDLADRRELTSIDDLVRIAPSLTIGGDPEFFERPEWIAVRDAYGLRFGTQRNFAPTFMYNALKSGEADVISAYTSDGRIVADQLAVLDDPRRAFPNYDAIVLVGPEARTDDVLLETLRPVIGRVDVALMREANLMVDRDEDKRTPAQAARWLAGKIGL